MRLPNAELRTREYLTHAEVESVTEAAKSNRYGHRDATMILIAYRHGFRASELVDLRWDQIDFNRATLAVRRAKRGTPSTHPIQVMNARPSQVAARARAQIAVRVHVRAWLAFHHGGLCTACRARWCGAGFEFKAHPHMLRHACGFALANKGHDTRSLQAYLGHRKFSTRCATPSCHLIGSRISGDRGSRCDYLF